ncbi:hypothetical protein INR49_032091 [Caranx melampygus]|nr:hypothetical protein INR49_032091 [Caranx melampygus]
MHCTSDTSANSERLEVGGHSGRCGRSRANRVVDGSTSSTQSRAPVGQGGSRNRVWETGH